jgi:hypothetical protein
VGPTHPSLPPLTFTIAPTHPPTPYLPPRHFVPAAGRRASQRPSSPSPQRWLAGGPHRDGRTGASRQWISPPRCSLPAGGQIREHMGVGGAPLPAGTKVAGGAGLLHNDESWARVPAASAPLPQLRARNRGVLKLGAEVAPLALCSPGAMPLSGDDEMVEFCAAAARSSHSHGVGLRRRPRGRPWLSVTVEKWQQRHQPCRRPSFSPSLSVGVMEVERRPKNYQQNSRGRENIRVREMRGLECPVWTTRGKPNSANT